MKNRFLFLVVLGMIWCFSAKAQSLLPGQFNIRESLLESIALQNGTAPDFETLLNELEKLQKKPLDLNSVNEDELKQLPFLTDFQIHSLLDYRKENGNLLSVKELRLISGYTDDIITFILPYVSVTANSDTSLFGFKNTARYCQHELILKTQSVLEKSAGYASTDPVSNTRRYPGNPWLYYARYSLGFNDHLQAGLTFENDPGEDFFTRSNRAGFDFNSAFISISDLGVLNSAVVGDFRLTFGQGLTLTNGAAPAKSSLPLNIIRRGNEIKAFSSTSENDFFRGMAASASLGRVVITAFYSARNRDANLTDTLSSGRIYFSSFQESGYHRTRSEITDERCVHESAAGGNIQYRGNDFRLGTTFVRYKFDKYLEAGDDLKDIHDFEGNMLINWGADYSITLKKVQLFGEASYGNHAWACLNGALWYLNKYASFSFLYRNYGAGYYSQHSDAFSEGSSNTNEEAVYAGMVIHPLRKLKISAYADFYRFPWLKFNTDAPSSGSDYLLQTDYSPNDAVALYLRLRYERDPKNVVNDTVIIPDVVPVRRTGIRLHVLYRLSERLLMQNRLEAVMVKQAGVDARQGFLLYQDAEYRFMKLPLTFDFRLAWFDTDDYDARIYAYEQDLTSGFSFPPLFKSGFRSYLMVRYDITKALSFRFRMSQTHFLREKTIGSGYDEIAGNTRSEIKLQLTLRL
jgi:hypothetical protein